MTDTTPTARTHTPIIAKGLHLNTDAISLLTQETRRAWLIGGLIAGSLLTVGLLGVGGAAAYYNDRPAPGVTYAATSIGGWTRTQLKDHVNKTIADARITVTAPDGTTWDASLADLGVTVDTDKTIDNMIAVKDTTGAHMVTRLNPLDRKTFTDVVYTIDRNKLETALTDHLVTAGSQATPSTVTYDQQANKYVATTGKDGQTPETQPVEQTIQNTVNDGGHMTVATTFKTIPMPISEQTAQDTAQQANQRLNTKITVSNGAKKQFTIPATEIVKTIGIQPDETNGRLDITYDDQPIHDYISQNASQLTQQAVKANLVLNADGSTLRTIQKGVDGMEVNNLDPTIQAAVTAIHDGKDATITADMKTIPHETESRTVDYTSPNGDPHAVVNLSEQKVYAYSGSTLVNTFLVSTGKPSTPSDNGRFFVNIKNRVMTMRGGSGADAYVTPNVQWVSFYNGGEGFHAAPWNPGGIASGTPKSHGCINMNPADAKWIYDFLPEGSMVEVVGSTPTGAVR